MIQLYNFFHLNLAYSAVSEEDRSKVIESCYWPLLRLARDLNLPFGIELSGYTLESIAVIDANWVVELASLVNDGPCELIGCGYAQVIGPLVPPEVTTANLRIGHDSYRNHLGVTPKLALLNEQAFSAGLVPLYREAGYGGIIMEWNNPAREYPEWNPEWRYFPQRAKGSRSAEIPLIWNKSISFQKFQRYVHGDMELDELLAYIDSHQASFDRAFPLYGNDVEVFDFRPGRYMTEASLHPDGEWQRIRVLYNALIVRQDLKFIKPSEVLKLSENEYSNHLLDLSTANQPIPVKKQDKYNVVRWAVTGRDDLAINTRCWRLFEWLMDRPRNDESLWRELCYLWSSDFRTHITETRWNGYLERLASFEAKIDTFKRHVDFPLTDKTTSNSPPIVVNRIGRWLDVQSDRLSIRFNCARGLAIESYTDHLISEHPLFGTLHHGFFEDIRYGADFYSGHLTLEMPGQHKITDLVKVEPVITNSEEAVIVRANIPTRVGLLVKTWTIENRTSRLILDVHWDLSSFLGSLRLGYVTLFPDQFDLTESCVFSSHNGGKELEHFETTTGVDHGRAVSFLVSANQVLGMTDGTASIGDGQKQVVAQCDRSVSALVGLVQHVPIDDKALSRLMLSGSEIDDTSKSSQPGLFEAQIVYCANEI